MPQFPNIALLFDCCRCGNQCLIIAIVEQLKHSSIALLKNRPIHAELPLTDLRLIELKSNHLTSHLLYVCLDDRIKSPCLDD